MGGSGRSGGGARDGGRGGTGPETPVARALAAALYSGADDDAALDTGASLLAAADPDEAGRELLLRGEEYVRRAWERGWLPADLDREARRQDWYDAARTALAEHDDPAERALAWIAAHVGKRFAARARYTVTPLVDPENARETSLYVEALGEDFLATMVWTVAGLVAEFPADDPEEIWPRTGADRARTGS